jgi:hypothetical protein
MCCASNEKIQKNPGKLNSQQHNSQRPPNPARQTLLWFFKKNSTLKYLKNILSNQSFVQNPAPRLF